MYFSTKPPPLSNLSVTYEQLREASRRLSFPHTLFFAEYNHLHNLIKKRNRQVLGALDGQHIVGSRGKLFDIRVLAPIIQDILAKQRIYNRYGRDKLPLRIIKYLKKSKRSSADQASYITQRLGINLEKFRAQKGRREAFRYLKDRLSANQIHVFVEARNHMPVNIPDYVDLSGFYIRSNTHPCLFIANELNEHPDEGFARKIYTMLFLLVAMFKGVSYAIYIDKESYRCDYEEFKPLEIHSIVHKILLTDDEVLRMSVEDYSSLEKYSLRYKISKPALLNRLKNTGLLDFGTYKYLMFRAEESFKNYIKKAKARRTEKSGGPSSKTMAEYYQGDFIRFLKNMVPKRLQREFFRRHVSYSRLKIDLGDF